MHASRACTRSGNMLARLLVLLPLQGQAQAPEQHDFRGEQVVNTWPEPTSLYRRGEPVVKLLSPSGASNEGNVTVLLGGTGFRDFGDVKVRFCSVEVRGHVLNEGSISCIAPPLSAMPQRQGFEPSPVDSTACVVDVTLNGVDYSRIRATFWYYNLSAVSIARMHPSGGPVAGGTRVNLDGVGFVDRGGGVQGAKCRFGETVVAATIWSHSTASCISPATAAGPVPVWLTLNGYTDERSLSGGLSFRFSPPATLSQLHPIGGPSAGGAIITVHGHGFIDDGGLTNPCRIGDDPLCEMHDHAVGMVRVDRQRSGLACVFGERGSADAVTVTGTVLGAGNEQLLCQTPPNALLRIATGRVGPWCAQHGNTTRCLDPAYAASALRAVEIRVTTNGNVSDASPTAVVYMALPPELPHLHHVQPWGGPPEGGTRVDIVGEELLSLAEMASPLCRFGHVEVPATVGGQGGSPGILSAPLVSRVALHDARTSRTVAVAAGRFISCISPPGHQFGSRWVRLSVALDGEHFSADTLSFRYTNFRVLGVHPSGGFLTGGTQLLVRGTGFSDFGGLHCVFGEVSVPATKVEARLLRCISPATDSEGAVTLSVSLNGDLDSRTLENGNVTFDYFAPTSMVVSSLSPARGPILGGTAVTLRGAGFVERGTVQCMFGTHPAVNASYATGSSAGSRAVLSEIVCLTPPRARPLDLDADTDEGVSLSISLTGDEAEFTDAGLLFNYQHPCHGRESIDGYPDANARDAVKRYLALNSPNLTRFDANEDGRLDAVELREAIRYSNDATRASADPSDAALLSYASHSCFLRHERAGREFARADDPRPLY